MGRFFRRGVSEIHFLPAVADPAAPTAAEVSAGTDLSIDVAEINGFELTNSPIPTPNLASGFTPQIEGEDTTPDSSLTFYDRNDDTTIRDALAKGTAGYILLAPYGNTVGERAEVWEVKSNGVNDQWSMGNDPARFMVPFSISSVPTQTGALAA